MARYRYNGASKLAPQAPENSRFALMRCLPAEFILAGACRMIAMKKKFPVFLGGLVGLLLFVAMACGSDATPVVQTVVVPQTVIVPPARKRLLPGAR